MKKLDDGRHRAHVVLRDPDGKRREVTVTAASEGAALPKLQTKLGIKPQTVAAYDAAIRATVKPTLGALRLHEVRVGRLDTVLADLEHHGISPLLGAATDSSAVRRSQRRAPRFLDGGRGQRDTNDEHSASRPLRFSRRRPGKTLADRRESHSVLSRMRRMASCGTSHCGK